MWTVVKLHLKVSNSLGEGSMIPTPLFAPLSHEEQRYLVYLYARTGVLLGIPIEVLSLNLAFMGSRQGLCVVASEVPTPGTVLST